MILIRHIKEDWRYRFPYRLRHNRYRGASRPSYVLICFLYYCLKSIILLIVALIFHLYKFLLWDIWKKIYDVFRSKADDDEEDTEDNNEKDMEDDELPEKLEYDDDVEELPFCQLFSIGSEMCLLIDHVEMCPDETAFIRVVDDEGYTPLYKRKVRRDKAGNRYIVFNGTNHYLVDSRTQPTSIKK